MEDVSVIFGVITFIIWLVVVFTIFKISDATQETSRKLDRVIELLEQQNNTKQQ